METTEKIVEAYVRYIKGWATIPNIKCTGQLEIDLLAIDPVTLDRYHIESGVSISGSYSKLTAKPFSDEALKQRVKQAGHRHTVLFCPSLCLVAEGHERAHEWPGEMVFQKGHGLW